MGITKKKLKTRRLVYIVMLIILFALVLQFCSSKGNEYVIEDAIEKDNDIEFTLKRFEYQDMVDDEMQNALLHGIAENDNDFPVECDIEFNLKKDGDIIENFKDHIAIDANAERRFSMEIMLYIGESDNDFVFNCENSG
ncbi:MAG: hypothetical protein ACLFTR_05490 [Candidatus Woesearchaeota archaeon]